ncbi:MAG: MarR family transcriptional regulator [Candidatus Kariarchaeaceae archaeon]|jgi:DNA-binding Lrp family transcriptional regulator
MPKIPLPTFQILQMLKADETLTPKQIQIELLDYSPKDIKYALRRLREKGVIKKIPNLVDMRRVFYRLATIDELSESVSLMKLEEYQFYLTIITGSSDIITSINQNDNIAKIS